MVYFPTQWLFVRYWCPSIQRKNPLTRVVNIQTYIFSNNTCYNNNNAKTCVHMCLFKTMPFAMISHINMKSRPPPNLTPFLKMAATNINFLFLICFWRKNNHHLEGINIDFSTNILKWHHNGKKAEMLISHVFFCFFLVIVFLVFWQKQS